MLATPLLESYSDNQAVNIISMDARPWSPQAANRGIATEERARGRLNRDVKRPIYAYSVVRVRLVKGLLAITPVGLPNLHTTARVNLCSEQVVCE